MGAGPADENDLSERLGHSFSKPALLQLALTHSSLGGRDAGGPNNERLEFLGDRVLGLVVAELLYELYPDDLEGALAQRQAVLVARDQLAEIAVTIGLDRHVAMASGEAVSGGRTKPSILADACEAVIGALFLDGGFEVARRFVRGQWQGPASHMASPPRDNKTALQEWAQERGLGLPSYRVSERTGPDHAPQFVVEVALTGSAPMSGTGSSKRAAEQAAAGNLLDTIGDGDG
ncbi:MAG: ribonuclease III [Geminicoccaceae bacterium]